MWRRVFLAQYDDPRDAAAFPIPRTGIQIEWKKQVIEREAVIGFLERHGREHTGLWDYQLPDDIENELVSWVHRRQCDGDGADGQDAWEARVFRTVLSMFLDIPPPGRLSANIPILISFLRTRTLAVMCHSYVNSEANHLEALLSTFSSFNAEHCKEVEQRFEGTKALVLLRAELTEREIELSKCPLRWAYPASAMMLLDPS